MTIRKWLRAGGPPVQRAMPDDRVGWDRGREPAVVSVGVTSRRRVAALVVPAVLFAAGVVWWTLTRPGPVGQAIADPGLVHVHGIDVDPADGALYAATHSGLFRVAEDGTADRVGEHWNDLMGFTIAGPGDFLASGHPAMDDPVLNDPDTKPLLGLVASDDGANWQPVSLFGEVDFHQMSAEHDRVYGWDSTTGRFMVSEDRRTWETRSEAPLVDFAVSPADPDVILGATDQGVMRSDDGGRTWRQTAEQPLATLVWDDTGPVGVAAYGTVLHGEVDGARWEPAGRLPGFPEALHVHQGVLYAAVTDRGLLQSRDGGASWSVILAPDPDAHVGR